MIFYTTYPNVIMMFCLTLTYSVIAPITLVWGVIYFGLSYWVWKYQLLYVYKPKHESYTWKFWPSVFGRLHAGIFIMQLILVSLFTTYAAVPQAALTLFTLIGTIASLNAANEDYAYYFDRPSLQTTVEFDKNLTGGDAGDDKKEELQDVAIKSQWSREELFTPPSVLCMEDLKNPQKKADSTLEVVAHGGANE